MKGEHLGDYARRVEREKAIACQKKMHLLEEDWKKLVEQGKARCVRTVESLNAIHYHYELI